jgi:hypothetical protein
MSGLFVRRSAHVNVRYFTNSLTPPTGLGLLTCRLRGGEVSVGQRVARSLPERWPAVLPQGRFIRGSSPSTRARWAALVTALFNRLLAVTTTRCATVNRSSIRSCILQGAKHRHSNGRNRSHLRPTGACHLFGRGVPSHAGLGILKPCVPPSLKPGGSRALAKTTTNLSAQDRVILF